MQPSYLVLDLSVFQLARKYIVGHTCIRYRADRVKRGGGVLMASYFQSIISLVPKGFCMALFGRYYTTKRTRPIAERSENS